MKNIAKKALITAAFALTATASQATFFTEAEGFVLNNTDASEIKVVATAAVANGDSLDAGVDVALNDATQGVRDRLGPLAANLKDDFQAQLDRIDATVAGQDPGTAGNPTLTTRLDTVHALVGGAVTDLDARLQRELDRFGAAPNAVAAPADLDVLLTRIGATNGSAQAIFDAAQIGVTALTPNGGAAGDFTNGTTGTAVAVIGAGNTRVENTVDAQLRSMAFNIFNSGVNAGANVNLTGIVTANGTTEDTVTWAQIVQALAQLATDNVVL